MLWLLAVAHATDTWTTIETGVDYLHRTTSEPENIFAVRVDLTVPNVGLHMSADADGTERHVTTPTFAANADVLVAINGDWSDGNTPVGLAISDGWLWHDHIADDTVGGQWGYFACTATKDCTIDAELPLDQAWWFSNPNLGPYRYFQAVGANGVILLQDGVPTTGCFDSVQNPRSAVCLDSAGTTLWLVVVDGRSSSSAGMTCDETRDLLVDLGCWDGAMLDGGGSSTMVIDGDVKNDPSDGSPRTVSNHIGIVYSNPIDAECVVANGRWCDGTTLGTCQGGRYLGSGDCAFYGASCEEDGDYAYCVDYRCPDGSGSGTACLDATNIASCNDGIYGTGDCGAFGLTCGTDASGAACQDSRCEAGPNSAFCTDGGLYAACSSGVYSETDCAASGLVCWEGAGAACIDSRCPSGPDGGTCAGDVYQSCASGTYAETDCAASGFTCDPTAGCVDPGAGGDTDTDTDPTGSGGGGDGSGGSGPGSAQRLDGLDACGCATTGPGSFGIAALTAMLAVRRRR